MNGFPLTSCVKLHKTKQKEMWNFFANQINLKLCDSLKGNFRGEDLLTK